MNTTIKQVNINTLSPIYDKEEDRIRLSLNYTDIHHRIDMMITRSFIIKVLPAIEEFSYKYYPNEPIAEEPILQKDLQSTQYDNINKRENSKSSNLSQTNIDDLEFYKGTEDLLWAINMSFDPITKLTTLVFESKNKHKARLKCDIHTLKNVIKSIKQSIPIYKWSITF